MDNIHLSDISSAGKLRPPVGQTHLCRHLRRVRSQILRQSRTGAFHFFSLKIFFIVSCLRVRVPPSLPSKLIGFPTNAKNHFQICFVAAGHFRSSLPGRKLNLCVNIISLLFIQPIIKKKES